MTQATMGLSQSMAGSRHMTPTPQDIVPGVQEAYQADTYNIGPPASLDSQKFSRELEY